MKIIIFTHPGFISHQSMPRYAQMLKNGLIQRGHDVVLWASRPIFSKLPVPSIFKKWMGYVDQYIVFPLEVKFRLKKCEQNTLYVFADHALGPWVPLVSHRNHIIHCHDFTAQQSALGKFSENPVGWSGRQYQAFIRRGYQKGKNFISISKKTQADLHRFLLQKPDCSEVVYNGLNQSFSRNEPEMIRGTLTKRLNIDLRQGYLLHVGGNQFYKNRIGVIQIYNAWRQISFRDLPLLLVGEKPSEKLNRLRDESVYKADIYFLSKIDDEILRMCYQGASLFLFPSLAEGFGWPIAEAMASGCPVITTNEAPMTEVAGDAGFFISKKPDGDSKEWALTGAREIENILSLSSDERERIVDSGLENAKRFDPEVALNRIEAIYQEIISQ